MMNILLFSGEASNGKHVTNMDTVRNMEWASSTCTLSFNTFGRSLKLVLLRLIFIDFYCAFLGGVGCFSTQSTSDKTSQQRKRKNGNKKAVKAVKHFISRCLLYEHVLNGRTYQTRQKVTTKRLAVGN